jgi:CheY-like chemotaxis protein
MPHRILVADDEAHIVELVRVSLEEFGVEVLDAPDGEAALAAARRHQPEILLLDVMMPRVDGFEVCRRLKADPLTRGIIVIMFTAKAMEADRQHAREVGAQGYVTKPFSPLQLASVVREHLRGLSSADE